MKQFGGWAFPDGETHLIEWMQKTRERVAGRYRYQGKKIDAALALCKSRRTAVDVGSHIGLWSFYLVQHFHEVHAFEPVALHRQCFLANLGGAGPGQYFLHPCALGEEQKRVSMHTSETSSGDTWVDGDGTIEMHRLDEFGLTNVDLVKIDCEGYELHVLRGAEDTLKRCKPVVIVEQKPGRAQKFGLPEIAAVDYLQALGAKLRATLSGDYLLSWDQ